MLFGMLCVQLSLIYCISSGENTPFEMSKKEGLQLLRGEERCQPPSVDCTGSSSSRTVCEKISPWLPVDWLESGGCVSTQCLNLGDLSQAPRHSSGGWSLLTGGE